MRLSDNSELPLPSNKSIRHLNELATAQLARMIRGGSREGYDDTEIVAAKALLDESKQHIRRGAV